MKIGWDAALAAGTVAGSTGSMLPGCHHGNGSGGTVAVVPLLLLLLAASGAATASFRSGDSVLSLVCSFARFAFFDPATAGVDIRGRGSEPVPLCPVRLLTQSDEREREAV